MRRGSGARRPSVPSHWGTEITVPTESAEAEIKFFIDDSERMPDAPEGPSTHLTPMEEYLEMTKRLIKSKTLSPRTSRVLKKLYLKYKSISESGTIPSRAVVDSIDSVGIRRDLDRREKPSTSKSFDVWTILSEDTFVERIEMPVIRRATTVPVEDPEPYWFTEAIQNIQSFSLDRPCDPEAIEVDNIFSDFSLANEGRDRALKKRVDDWMRRESENAPGPSGSRPEERRLTKIELIKKLLRGKK